MENPRKIDNGTLLIIGAILTYIFFMSVIYLIVSQNNTP